MRNLSLRVICRLRTFSLCLAATFCVAFFCSGSAALGQGITTGTISGTVTDPSGAVVPGAAVIALDPTRGTQLTTQAGGDGAFDLRQVPIGSYRITVSAKGFAATQADDVQVRAGATTDLGAVQLKIGSAEQVEVNASDATLLETSDSQVTTTLSAQQLQSLPLNNGFDTATELIPGVVSTHGDNFSNANGDNYSVNGQSGRYNNSELDGQSNNDNSIGGRRFSSAAKTRSRSCR